MMHGWQYNDKRARRTRTRPPITAIHYVFVHAFLFLSTIPVTNVIKYQLGPPCCGQIILACYTYKRWSDADEFYRSGKKWGMRGQRGTSSAPSEVIGGLFSYYSFYLQTFSN